MVYLYFLRHILYVAELEISNAINFLEFNFFFGFFAKLVNFSANFGSLNVQIRNNFKKNVIFITCKWRKICKYLVSSMVISLSPVKTKKKNAFGLNILFTLFFRNLKFVVIYAFFLPILYSQNFIAHKTKCFFLQLCYLGLAATYTLGNGQSGAKDQTAGAG